MFVEMIQILLHKVSLQTEEKVTSVTVYNISRVETLTMTKSIG